MSIGLIAWGRFDKRNAKGEVIRDGNGNPVRITVPAPPTDPGKPWLADMLRENAAAIAASFDVVQWPSFVKAQGGTGDGCDGYEPVDLRDFGSKNAQGSLETRYGSLEQFMAAVAALDAHGVASWGDLVLHQQGGENLGPGKFSFVGADGKTMNGRGATTPGWFRGNTGNNNPIPPFSPQDDVPDPLNDSPFGRERCYQKCNPPRATTEDALDAFHLQVKRTGARGFRFDDVKGIYAPFVSELMYSSNLPFYSEYFDANPGTLNGWATSSPLSGRSAVEDFTMHFRIQAACDNFNATLLDQGGAGYWQINAGLAVGFVDNPDSDTSPGQQVVFNKGLAYAWMLCLPLRMALVYGKDYFPGSVWPGAYGLRPIIDNLCWISRMFAFGAFERRYVDQDVYVYTRDGNGGSAGWSGGLLMGINFNTLEARTVTVDTTFGPNRWLHDYTGHAPDISTDGNGRAAITIPSNAFSAGHSFVGYAPGGVSQSVPIVPHRTTHTYVGDRTLDVMPALNGGHTLPQRIHVAQGSRISLNVKVDRAGWTSISTLAITVVGPNNKTVSSQHVTLKGQETKDGEATQTGFHTIHYTGTALPETGSNFEADVTYLGAR